MTKFDELDKAEQAEIVLSGKCLWCLRDVEERDKRNCTEYLECKIKNINGSSKHPCLFHSDAMVIYPLTRSPDRNIIGP